jgi:radical SAM-linked protein
MAKTMLRACFEKSGRAVYISHLDLMRTISRAFRRTDIPFWYTEGFTPRVHLDFLLPLPLGVIGLDEFFDFAVLIDTETAENAKNAAAEKLNKVLPDGIKITSIGLPIYDRNEIAKAKYEITLTGVSTAGLTDFFDKDIINARKFSKKSGEKIIDIKPFLGDVEICENGEGDTGGGAAGNKETSITLKITLPAGNKLNINTSVLIGALKEQFGNDLEILCEKRTKILLDNGKEFS